MFRQADVSLTNSKDEEAVELGIVGVGKAGLQRIWATAAGLTDHRLIHARARDLPNLVLGILDRIL